MISNRLNVVSTNAAAIMTLIMGAKCSNGVVLVADRKVTPGDLSAFDYRNKIFNGIRHMIYGSVGSTKLFVGQVEDYVMGNI